MTKRGVIYLTSNQSVSPQHGNRPAHYDRKKLRIGAKGWLVGCRLKANCPLMRSGPIGGVSSMGIFQRDPSPYLYEFWKKKKHGKFRTARSASVTKV